MCKNFTIINSLFTYARHFVYYTIECLTEYHQYEKTSHVKFKIKNILCKNIILNGSYIYNKLKSFRHTTVK